MLTLLTDLLTLAIVATLLYLLNRTKRYLPMNNFVDPPIFEEEKRWAKRNRLKESIANALSDNRKAEKPKRTPPKTDPPEHPTQKSEPSLDPERLATLAKLLSPSKRRNWRERAKEAKNN
jgi:hypothetical protein